MPEETPKISEEELRQRLADLDEALRSRVREQAMLLNREDMMAVIKDIRLQDSRLAEMLEQLMARLDFQPVLDALQPLDTMGDENG